MTNNFVETLREKALEMANEEKMIKFTPRKRRFDETDELMDITLEKGIMSLGRNRVYKTFEMMLFGKTFDLLEQHKDKMDSKLYERIIVHFRGFNDIMEIMEYSYYKLKFHYLLKLFENDLLYVLNRAKGDIIRVHLM